MNGKRAFEVPGTETSPTFSSYADLNRHLAKDQLGDEANPKSTANWRGLARAAHALWVWLAHRQQEWRTRDALMGCSDRVLADIGIKREDIPLIAKGIDPREHQSGATQWWRRWRTMRTRLNAAHRARREWRRVYRELTAYTDRELAEIGIRRPDIARILREQPTPLPAR